MTEWQDLELDEIADWPRLPQCLAALVLALVLAGAGYWFWLTPAQADLARLKQQESELYQQLVLRANQAAALPLIRQQLTALGGRYQQVVQQLPEEKELASLLSGINDIGIRNGLDFQRIEWAPMEEHPLFFELPISIELTGSYEEIGQFAAAVAALSRIVTLNDFKLDLVSQPSSSVVLKLTVSASTYRFKSPQQGGK